VAWLLVACIPVLLMFAALGLGRLEKELARDTVTATDVDEFLDCAEAVDVHTLAREGMPEALEYLHRRQALRPADSPPVHAYIGPRHAAPGFATALPERDRTLVPARVPTPSHVNPQLSGAKYVNRV
jgi:hypothetical protein